MRFLCERSTDPEPYQRGFLSYLNYRRSHLTLCNLKHLVDKAFYVVEMTLGPNIPVSFDLWLGLRKQCSY